MPVVNGPYKPGTPCWIDLMVPDQHAATAGGSVERPAFDMAAGRMAVLADPKAEPSQ
ncbi:VOC family protein [Streptomyces sp. NPDC055056]